MHMSGQKLIHETRENVWKALNSPEILRNCIPGCQSLEKTSETEMQAVAAIRVGPVSAKFGGRVSLSELNEPISYRITGEGQGGVAGFAKGEAFIQLEDVEGGTMLTYTVDAQVGGKLAQLGGRLIDATAKKMSEAFFEKFALEIRRQYHGEGAATEGGASAVPPAPLPQASPGVAVGVSPLAQPPLAEPAGSYRMAFLATLVLALVFGFLWLTSRQGGVPQLAATAPLSPEFGAAVQLILVAAVGYLFGRLSDR
ncbi:carbon monoxide dehydrogenase [Frigidibacter albus]|uniref:Carbon monoxide dehydrogenase n=1 Tax=Frigidibacter albus TaxID=1465486 RepID=A0A6L8VMW7_9RHOB|nr:carbon monoxide dehydrogenase subunit G [Frigidibacter albus]MZQ91141.1 carbon monoxide dehydrogenase [Frigidibacter albus]NBE33048.1 carbon monoxide dehydrogenase [Frigidibacter albus]GGH63004.1 hypothetical protein GCM10011341_37730 [Frigidibacter albus]